MSYLAGLLTIPAIAGSIAAIWWLYENVGAWIDKLILRKITHNYRDERYVKDIAAVFAATSNVWILRVLPKYLCVFIGLGPTDPVKRKEFRAALDK